MKRLFFILLLVTWSLQATGQDDLTHYHFEPDTVEHGYMPAQFTLTPPMGTNGAEAPNITNSISLNLLAGNNGGLAGFELGGISNKLQTPSYGVQLAGISNKHESHFLGVAASGLANTVRGNGTGLFVAGIANTVKGASYAVQLAGLANTSESITGAQVAGLASTARGSASGVQVGGLAATANGNMTGIQVGGLAATTNGALDGVQVGGLSAKSHWDSKGIQVSGLSSRGEGRFLGIQLAGLSTKAESMKGLQVSGLATRAHHMLGLQVAPVNRATTLTGLQVGLINVVDRMEHGVSIGLLSVVKENGYQSFELSANELTYVNLGFRTGMDYFYNIFNVGLFALGQSDSWTLGYGLGSRATVYKNTTAGLELTAHHYNVGQFWTDRRNFVYQATLPITSIVGENTEFVIGPAVRIHHLENATNGEALAWGTITPYESFSETRGNATFTGWIGGTVGVRF